MGVTKGLYSGLKDLGTLNWKEVIERGLYNESLLLNRLPDCDFIAGQTVIEEISNRKEGHYCKVVLDLDFLKAKMQKHICKYFNKSQEAQYLEFCKQVWQDYQNKELNNLIQEIIALKGGTHEQWLKVLSK